MAKLPRLKVIYPYGVVPEDIRDFEQGKYLPFGERSFIITVEGQVIRSYEEFVQLAAEERHKDKEFLEVRLLQIIGGG